MVDEVELQRERSIAVRQRVRRQPARRDVERDAPAVIDRRRLRQRDLADHLRPHVQRRVGVLPRVVRQGGPEIVAHRCIIRRTADFIVRRVPLRQLAHSSRASCVRRWLLASGPRVDGSTGEPVWPHSRRMYGQHRGDLIVGQGVAERRHQNRPGPSLPVQQDPDRHAGTRQRELRSDERRRDPVQTAAVRLDDRRRRGSDRPRDPR